MFQIRKGSKYLVFFVVIFVALPPFAIDAYIPAFGNIGSFFNIDVNKLAITISTYFIGFGVGMFFGVHYQIVLVVKKYLLLVCLFI